MSSHAQAVDSHAHSHAHDHALVVHKHPSDFVGAKIAMWMFLFTEVLLFGGLFIAYAVYRAKYPVDFHNAAIELNTALGGLNTLVLLTSSLTVAISIEALQRRNRKLSLWMLAITIICAATFMVIKYFEWGHKFHIGLYPGSEVLLQHSNGENVFFSLYYVMTGLHGIHVLVGMAVLGTMFYFKAGKPRELEQMNYEILAPIRGKSHLAVLDNDGKEIGKVIDIDDKVEHVEIKVYSEPSPDKINPRHIIQLENSGLYWHIVDIIWIFLFPLFYLIT